MNKYLLLSQKKILLDFFTRSGGEGQYLERRKKPDNFCYI